MRKSWHSAVLVVLGTSTAAVLLWAGVLVFRWYEGYSLGILIAEYATRDDHPANVGQGAQQRMQAWRDFENRGGLVRERLAKSTEWQRNIALTTAFDRWRACEPRPGFGTWHFWSLLFDHEACDLMERMVDTPMTKTHQAPYVAQSVADAMDQLKDQSHLLIWQACPDRDLVVQSYRPAIGRSLREELDEITSQNDLRWERIDQLIVVGADAELAEFQSRVKRGHDRIGTLQNSPPVRSHTIAEKLTDPVTLEFVETPLSDVTDFLRDYTGVNVLIPFHGSDVDARTAVGFSDQPVSVHVQSVPLRLALDCLLMPSGLDWDAVDELLLIAKPDDLADFVQRVKLRHERVARLRNSRSPDSFLIADKLTDRITLEFVETPLGDIASFLQDYSGAKFYLLGGPRCWHQPSWGKLGETPVTVHVEDVSMATALDCISDRTCLEWDVLEGVVVFGSTNRIRDFRSRLIESDRRLAQLNGPVADALRGRNEKLGDPSDGLLWNINSNLKSSRIHLEIPPTIAGDWFVPGFVHDLPLYRQLDYLHEVSGLDWELISPDMIRLIETKGDADDYTR